MKFTDSIKSSTDAQAQGNSATNQTISPPKPVTSAIPDYFQRATVFGVLPVDDSSGELRTGISFKLENGETIWLNLSCTDAE